MASNNSSDSLLLVLAVVAVLVSAVGLFASMGVFGVSKGITGYQVSNQTSGVVNVTISQNLIIRMNVSSIDFGPGAINPGAQSVVLQSNQSGTGMMSPAGGTFNRNANGDGNAGQGLLLENIGNVNASIYVRSSASSVNFSCGTDGACLGNPFPHNPNFTLAWSMPPGNNTCNGAGNTNAAWPMNNWVDVNSSSTNGNLGTWVCGKMNYLPNVGNRLNFHVRIVLPENSPPGLKTATITFTGNPQCGAGTC